MDTLISDFWVQNHEGLNFCVKPVGGLPQEQSQDTQATTTACECLNTAAKPVPGHSRGAVGSPSPLPCMD
jgi:hypothetical protein